MRAWKLLLCSTLIPIALTDAVNAEDRLTTVGDWTVLERTRDEGRPNPLCIAAAARDSSAATFAMDNNMQSAESPRQGSARLIFFMPDRLSQSDQDVIDGVSILTSTGKSWTDLKANWSAKDGVGTFNTFVDDDVTRVLKTIGVAGSLQITVPQATGEPRSYKVSLKGSYAALEEYKRCLALIK
jgi:hypothetical protein